MRHHAKIIRATLTASLMLVAMAGAVAAEPLLTISCEKPEGFNMKYGVSVSERLRAEENHQPEPKPTFKGPTKDGYVGKPTFVVDTNEKNVTVIWAELPEDVELRKSAKEHGLPMLPPPAASSATIVQFFKQQIIAVELEPWSITTYSFFPKMGIAFIAQQSLDLGLRNATQLAVFSTCEFSWANGQ